VRDDGTLRGSIDEGNGLTGMRERLAQLQGSLQLDEFEDALLLRVNIPVTG
jgi:signal transduction histidine kinase